MEKGRNEIFKTGAPLPEMFAKCFIGQAYLQPLTDKGRTHYQCDI